jgi:hypothetical protein
MRDLRWWLSSRSRDGTRILTQHGATRSTKHGSTPEENKGAVLAVAARGRSGLSTPLSLMSRDEVCGRLDVVRWQLRLDEQENPYLAMQMQGVPSEG